METEMIAPPKIIELPSGATLKINLAPFADAKALYKALFRELKSVQINSKTDMTALVKDALFGGLSSDAVEAAVQRCAMRCTIDKNNKNYKIKVISNSMIYG